MKLINKKAKADQQNRPLKQLVEQMLDDLFQTRLSQTFTQQMNGASCMRFVQQGAAIMTALQNLFIDELDLEQDRDLIVRMRHALKRLGQLCKVMDFISEKLYNFDAQTEEEIVRFETACIVTGRLWRVLELSVTLKVHCTETQLAAEFRNCLGRYGHFNEGAVERAHAEDNKGNRTYANIASPEARNEAKDSAKSQSSIAAVVEITDATAAGLKRNFGEISKGKRAVKNAEAVIDKQQKLVELDALLKRLMLELPAVGVNL
jgi:hypothetical protein